MTDDVKPNPRRVLIIIRQFFPLAGGAETQCLRQAKSYIEIAHPTRVLTSRHDPSLAVEDTVEGVPVTRLGAWRVRFLGSAIFLARLAAYLVRHLGDYDAVLVFQLKQAAMLASLLCPFFGKRVVLSDQAGGAIGDVQALKVETFGRLIFWASSKAAAIVSGSSEITDELVGAGIPRRKVHFIPNGIPMESFGRAMDRAAARKALGVPGGAFVVVNVGRHAEVKDLGTLLAAWRDLSQTNSRAQLIFVGDGEERPRLEALAREWRLANVRFEGWRSNVPDYLAAADAFASCSKSEGTHLALGEAMAAGLPVVATPVGGARDYVRDGENGFLVPVGDWKALSAALGRLASAAGLRKAMGDRARSAAQSLLAQDKTARAHLDLLFGPLRRPKASRKVRVTYLIATLDRGGSERQMAELAARLDRAVFAPEVICLTRGGPTAQVLDAAKVPYGVIGRRARLDLLPLVLLAVRFFMRPPALLHTWLFTSNFIGRVVALAAGVQKTIVSERSTDLWKSRLHRAADRILAVRTEKVIANSGAVARTLVAPGIPRRKIAIIPNGLDLERFKPRDAREARSILGLSLDGPCFGYIGRLAYEKRPDLFLKVAEIVLAQMPDARAVVFGEGPLADVLKAQSWKIKGRLTFYGDCPNVEVAHAALDCLVLTSQWEGFPNAVLEAMATARPVVAVRMPATEELVDEGATGILVSDGADALAGAVIELLKDPGRAREMGRLGRAKAERLYSMDAMVKAYERLYLDVLMRRPGQEG